MDAVTLSAEWSATKLSTFHTCLAKFRFRYVLGMGEPSTNQQEYGKGVHRGLEAWLNHHHEGPDVRLAKALEAVDLADPIDAARATAVLIGYEVRWGSVIWRVLAVEVPFRYDLDGHIIHGQIDAIVQTEDGAVFIVEHKNTVADTSPGSSYWEVLTVDKQVGIYIDAGTVLGYDIAGCIYDALGRPRHEVLKATPEAARKYTQGKGCKPCGGKAGKRGEADRPACPVCGGTGWEDAPRLYAGQRDADESLADYSIRIGEAIATAPDGFYQRSTIVRIGDELPKMRHDILNTIRLARMCEVLDMWPRGNSSACKAWGSLCHFFPICSGAESPDNEIRFPRRTRDESQAPVTPV